jgi:hypothetical protein
MEENVFSLLKDAMQSIPIGINDRIRSIIKLNYIEFKEYCLSSCSNSVQTDQFNTIFSILTSPDHQALRRGLIYKSQKQSIT